MLLISNGLIIQWVSAINVVDGTLIYPKALNQIVSITNCYIPKTIYPYEYRVGVCKEVTNTSCCFWFHDNSKGDIWFIIIGY